MQRVEVVSRLGLTELLHHNQLLNQSFSNRAAKVELQKKVIMVELLITTKVTRE